MQAEFGADWLRAGAGSVRFGGVNGMFRVIRLAIVLLAGPGSLGAVELVGTPRVELGTSSATIRWTTDSECGARVRFGTAPGPLVQTAGGEGVGTVHVVTLDGLQAGH